MSTKVSSSFRSALSARFGDRVQFDEPLARHLAYRVGGPADVLIFPKDEAELSWISLAAKEHGLPITIIGNGTNLLVVDEGIRGITISLSLAFKGVEIIADDGCQTHVRCGGGTSKPELLEWALKRGLAGLEFSAGVPGTIGGGIYMNAGTKYGCYGDILKEARLFDFVNGGKLYQRQELQFGYRESTVQGKLVVWVTFLLSPKDPGPMRLEVDRIIAERAEKQPLNFPSCGSTFKNPEGLSAGRLIEKAGLKGLAVGGAEVSTKHANFILNKGSATAKDILTLIATIKARVYDQFGVELECEVIVLGADNNDEGKVSQQT